MILGVVVANCSGDSLPIGKPGAMGIRSEYHLIDLATALSHGGFQSLQAARQHAREEDLIGGIFFAEMSTWSVTIRAPSASPKADSGQSGA